jgi:photosystem II stability/assembly factor-like uncharacterized protein
MKSKNLYFLTLTILLVISFSCKKKETTPPTPVTPSPTPSVITSAITNVTDSTAVSGGSVTSEGTSAITAVGICWDTLPNPTTLRNHTNEGAGTGSYISNLVNLKLSKTYYVRAYATNFNGTSYGNEITLTMRVPSTWKKANNTYTFTCLFSTGASIFAGTNNGIIFSSDTGNTWTPKGLSGVSISNIVQKGNAIFATGGSPNSELYKSIDNGGSWTSLAANFPYPLKKYDVAVTNNKVFVGTDSSAFYSNDDGNTWNSAWTGMPLPGSFLGMGGSVYSLASTTQSVYAFANNWGGNAFLQYLYKYVDGSNSWNSGGITLPQYSSASGFKGCGNNLFVSSGNQTMVSKNGGFFTNVSELPLAVNLSASDASILGSNSSGYFSVSKDYGTTWTRIKTLGLPLPASYGSAFVSSYYLWVNTNDGLYKYKYN